MRDSEGLSSLLLGLVAALVLYGGLVFVLALPAIWGTVTAGRIVNEWVEKCELLDPDSKTRQEVGQLDDGLLAELRKEYASVDECADTQRNAKMSLSIRRSLGYYLLIAVFVALVKGGALLGQRFRYRGNGETLN